MLPARGDDETVYHDQPIPPRDAPFPALDCPPRLLEMQRLALKLTLRAPAERIFYEQARLMADYEDDRPWRGRLFRDRPTYTSLNLAQLRGYFTWRSRVRQGIFERAPQPFAFLYMQELIHLAGADTAEEAFRLLLDFRLRYRRFDFGVDPFCRMWLHDLVVYYGLDAALADETPTSGGRLAGRGAEDETRRLLPLACRDEYPPEALGAALESLAVHNLAASPAARDMPERFRAALGRAFLAVMDDLEARDPGGGILGEWESAPYEMFKGAVFADPLAHEPGRDPIRRRVSDSRFFCEQGRWRRERFFLLRGGAQRKHRKDLAALVRAVDSRMRQAWGLGPVLKMPAALPPAWLRFVDAAVRAEHDEALRQEVGRLPIDLARLAGIRADADRVRDRLIVPGGADDDGAGETEALPVPARPLPAEPVVETAARRSATGPASDGEPPLDAPEQALLRALLNHDAAPPVPPGRSLALLVDAVNDKLYERFGDTVIVFADDRPSIPEEYHQELRTLLDRDAAGDLGGRLVRD